MEDCNMTKTKITEAELEGLAGDSKLWKSKVEPDREDFEAVTREYGTAHSDQDAAHHYRLAQAHKLIREAGLEADLDMTKGRNN
jgi:hypothetical protein